MRERTYPSIQRTPGRGPHRCGARPVFGATHRPTLSCCQGSGARRIGSHPVPIVRIRRSPLVTVVDCHTVVVVLVGWVLAHRSHRRVRRRTDDKARTLKDLEALGAKIQESLAHSTGWVYSDSSPVGEIDSRPVTLLRAEVAVHARTAWAMVPCGSCGRHDSCRVSQAQRILR